MGLEGFSATAVLRRRDFWPAGSPFSFNPSNTDGQIKNSAILNFCASFGAYLQRREDKWKVEKIC